MVMGRITINCYETDFSSGESRYILSGIALGFTYLGTAVTNFPFTQLFSISTNSSIAFSIPKTTGSFLL